jgi:hypothetical protein
MTALADKVDGVIGVDTHRDTLSAAAVTAVGGLLGQLVVAADAVGYGACSPLPASMSLVAAALRLKVPAAMALGWRGCWSTVASGG